MAKLDERGKLIAEAFEKKANEMMAAKPLQACLIKCMVRHYGYKNG